MKNLAQGLVVVSTQETAGVFAEICLPSSTAQSWSVLLLCPHSGCREPGTEQLTLQTAARQTQRSWVCPSLLGLQDPPLWRRNGHPCAATLLPGR